MSVLPAADDVTAWLALDRQHCWHPFTQAQTASAPLLIQRAQGAYLWDAQGRRYFDAVSSWWVNLHGHAHPVIARALAEQAARMEQVMFAGLTHPPAIALAQALAQRSPEPLRHVFYSDNGSTAVEVALKMACQYWANRGGRDAQRRRRFLSLEGGYHGDTFGAMAAGRSSGFYTPFAPWLFQVDALPIAPTWWGHDPQEDEARSLEVLRRHLAQHGDEVVAFILEPLVQGAAGMRMMRPGFVREATRLCQDAGIPVIFDEVMTGFGRTGSFLAADQVADPAAGEAVVPDMLCLSKGLTGGFLPMGATLAAPHLYEAFLGEEVDRALLHGHSYTANPLGCAAALASLALFEQEGTLQRIAQHEGVHRRLLGALADHPLVEHPRLQGSIAAFDVRVPPEQARYGAPVGQWLRERLRELGVLVRPLGRTLYFIAPYCATEDDFEQAYARVRQALDEWQAAGISSAVSEHF